MSADLEFDYKKALKKLNVKDSDVNELREKVRKIEKVPKNLSSKKVWKVLKFEAEKNHEIFSAFVLFECLQRSRRCRKRDVNLLWHPTKVPNSFPQSRSTLAGDSTMSTESALFSLAKHTSRAFRYLSLLIKPQGFELCFWRSLQDVFYDDRQIFIRKII